MPKLLSCGVIVRRMTGELLLCHATGRSYWDIPKGLRDAGETSIDAALRELREETGLHLSAQQLQDLGVHRYLPRKDLQLFVLQPPDPSIDIGPCACSTYYTIRGGSRQIPEVDAYRWAPRDQVPELSGKNMTRVLMALDW
ncbi:MAG: NUDIX domain-containing protein [Burkholderiaceae bacterium]